MPKSTPSIWAKALLSDTISYRQKARHQAGQMEAAMQGVVKAYDPASGDGVIMCDSDMNDYELAANALEGSIFRMLRQGQRVIFQLDSNKQATKLSLGSEVDMATPGH
jgi:CspA family cold shock protein